MKTEADKSSVQEQPQLPTLPSPKLWRMHVLVSVEKQLFSSQVIHRHTCQLDKERKSALDDLLGDVFVTKVVPEKSVFQIVKSELASYKVKETMPFNSNPLSRWKAN